MESLTSSCLTGAVTSIAQIYSIFIRQAVDLMRRINGKLNQAAQKNKFVKFQKEAHSICQSVMRVLWRAR